MLALIQILAGLTGRGEVHFPIKLCCNSMPPALPLRIVSRIWRYSPKSLAQSLYHSQIFVSCIRNLKAIVVCTMHDLSVGGQTFKDLSPGGIPHKSVCFLNDISWLFSPVSLAVARCIAPQPIPWPAWYLSDVCSWMRSLNSSHTTIKYCFASDLLGICHQTAKKCWPVED